MKYRNASNRWVHNFAESRYVCKQFFEKAITISAKRHAGTFRRCEWPRHATRPLAASGESERAVSNSPPKQASRIGASGTNRPTPWHHFRATSCHFRCQQSRSLDFPTKREIKIRLDWRRSGESRELLKVEWILFPKISRNSGVNHAIYRLCTCLIRNGATSWYLPVSWHFQVSNIEPIRSKKWFTTCKIRNSIPIRRVRCVRS